MTTLSVEFINSFQDTEMHINWMDIHSMGENKTDEVRSSLLLIWDWVHSEVIAMKSVAQTAESLGTIRGYWHNVSGQADPK